MIMDKLLKLQKQDIVLIEELEEINCEDVDIIFVHISDEDTRLNIGGHLVDIEVRRNSFDSNKTMCMHIIEKNGFRGSSIKIASEHICNFTKKHLIAALELCLLQSEIDEINYSYEKFN